VRPTVAEILADHVTLSVNCVDRILVNGWIPKLQGSGGLVYFLRDHRRNPVVSPALLGHMGKRFDAAVKRFAAEHEIPLVRFERGQRKDDVANDLRKKRGDAEGVVFLGVAQERCKSFKGTKSLHPTGAVHFDFTRQSVYVNQLYFYLEDLEWGPAFLKMSTYIPYEVKLCLNGHEWVKRQLGKEEIPFESLDNGFLSCGDPQRLQQLCDQLGADQIESFFERWSARLPWPLTPEDRKAGFDHDLSLWQMEVSLTHIFREPLAGRHFFDRIIRDHLELGRPDRLRLLFDRRITRRTPPPRFGYRTRVITADVNPSLHIEYKRTDIKQYFKWNRGLRTETTFNNTYDFAIGKSVRNFWQLKTLGDSINRRLLETQRVADDCYLSSVELDALRQPTCCDGQRVSALRFGDPRVMALLAGLCQYRLQPHGFRNRDLRRQVESLLGSPYTSAQMTYDLRRLRRRKLIQRQPGTHRYLLTRLGLRLAYLFSRLYLKLVKPAWAALLPEPSSPQPVRTALRTLDKHLERLHDLARLRPAA
jgi:hypothetical protein